MQAEHHRVCSLAEGVTFLVGPEQKDGDSPDYSAASSYGRMRSGMVTRTHSASHSFFPHLAFPAIFLAPIEGIQRVVFYRSPQRVSDNGPFPVMLRTAYYTRGCPC